MKLKSRTVAIGGLSAAVALVIMWIASIMPTAEIGLAALAGVCVVLPVMSGGRLFGLTVYAASAALALLLLPDKNIAVMFTLFFGHYPILKSVCEHIPNRAIEWVCKLAIVNVCLAGILLLVRTALMLPQFLEQYWGLIFLGASALFVIYDIGLTGVIFTLRRRLGKLLH